MNNVKDKIVAEIILDESGSMSESRAAAVSGVNEFIKGITEEVSRKSTVSLVKFSTVYGAFNTAIAEPVRTFWDSVLLETKPELHIQEYTPGGGTPLYDAMGGRFTRLLTTVPEGVKVSVVIVSDGEENQSREFTKDAVSALIQQMRDRNWLVSFIGCDFDVLGEGASLGVSYDTTLAFNRGNLANTMATAASAATRYYRSGDLKDAAYTRLEREAARK